MSQQLKALEIRYNRRSSSVDHDGAWRSPKPAGCFYAECRELLDRFRALEERMRTPSEAIAGTVRLATVYSIGLHELPPYVTRFMRAHPRVKVHIEYSRTDKICEDCQDDTGSTSASWRFRCAASTAP